MLILPIKKKWLDMILSGEKGDEYREIKPYWTVRIMRWLGFPATETETVLELLRKPGTLKAKPVILQNMAAMLRRWRLCVPYPLEPARRNGEQRREKSIINFTLRTYQERSNNESR